MSAELIGILGVGVALMVGLGGLILTISGWLRGDIRELAGRVAALERGVGGLEQRVARIEGLFEGAGLSRAGEPAEVTGD